MGWKQLLRIGILNYIVKRDLPKKQAARSVSKHAGGKQYPKNWRLKRQAARKRQKLARRANR